MPDLKLIALDEEDLMVLSAHLQDAVAKVGEMIYQPRARRFVALVNRFDWAAAGASRPRGRGERRRSGLRFERVTRVRQQGISPDDKARVLSLLAIQFAPGEPPGGRITFVFSGDAEIELEVECIEAILEDGGAAWSARRRPRHP